MARKENRTNTPPPSLPQNPKNRIFGEGWRIWKIIALMMGLILIGTGCQGGAGPGQIGQAGVLKVTAIETFLADMAQNVAGERLKVDALVPDGIDPHEFEPAPQDIVKLAQADVIIANGAGIEPWLQKTIENAGDRALVIQAAAGLKGRTAREGETVDPSAAGTAGATQLQATDPHFWLDPNDAIRYVENIRDGLGQADPQGQAVYAQNAAAYIDRLKALDAWIKDRVSAIPPEQRLLVTNHESFGYFADRYGFRIVGTIVPSVSTDVSPSAQQLARLVDSIKASQAKAIFLETGTNPQLANEVGRETGVKVVTDLFTHSISAAGSEAPTYIEMIKYDVNAIVGALK